MAKEAWDIVAGAMPFGRWLVVMLVAVACACGSPANAPQASAWLKVHDDLSFGLAESSKQSPQRLEGIYEVRHVEEPIGPGEMLRIQLVTKILDERERALLARDANAIGEIWPNSLTLQPSTLVSHVTGRAWQAFDFDPSGLAHDDFEGGHSTYRTPTRLTLTVAFVHHGALIVVHAAVELEHRPNEPSQAVLTEKYEPVLAGAMRRLQRRSAR